MLSARKCKTLHAVRHAGSPHTTCYGTAGGLGWPGQGVLREVHDFLLNWLHCDFSRQPPFQLLSPSEPQCSHFALLSRLFIILFRLIPKSPSGPVSIS